MKNSRAMTWWVFTLHSSLLILNCSCGYHVAGRATTIPQSIHTISVPAFRNETSRFKIEQSLTSAVVRELLARTRYRVQSVEDGSDAVLRGTVIAYWAYPVVFDPQNGRATTVSINLRLRVSLADRKTGKPLYENPDYTFSERYEISQETSGYFEESSAAVERLSKSLAADLVSAILEGF